MKTAFPAPMPPAEPILKPEELSELAEKVEELSAVYW
jgi:hypothetical protein